MEVGNLTKERIACARAVFEQRANSDGVPMKVGQYVDVPLPPPHEEGETIISLMSLVKYQAVLVKGSLCWQPAALSPEEIAGILSRGKQ